MPTVLITGTNRGLGLEFVRQYAEAGWKVHACARAAQQCEPLHMLARDYAQLTLHDLDVAEHDQIDALGHELRGATIDILLNNAGVYGDAPGGGFGQLDYATWEDVFWVNTVAAVKMAEVFVEPVARSQRRVIAAVSTLMASMGDNGSGGSLFYRSTKAALNAAMVTLARDLAPRGIAVAIMHPGWVRTDMGGAQAPLLPPVSIAGMRQVLDDITLADSGCFLNYDGSELPW